MKFGILDGNNNVLVGFVAPVRIINNAPAFTADSVSLRRYAISQKAQRWEIKTNLEPESSSQNWFIHNCQHGYANPFWIRMPQPYGIAKAGSPTSNPATTASASLGASSVTLSGTQTIRAGSFIKFLSMGHSKVYMLQNEVTATQRDAILFPNLIAAVSSGTTVVVKHSEVTMKCVYGGDTGLGIVYTDGILSDPGEISIIESI